jgi:phosphoribosylglycinamide formyltransferase 2
MNRQAIRDLAAHELKLRTARYTYAHHLSECEQAVLDIGLPCVIKPLMSSSGKGQSVIHQISDIAKSWDYALNNSRGDLKTIIVEEFIHFHTEITLLTVTQKNGPTLFCPAIGHRQERGDYQESWLPCAITESQYKQACTMADAVTHSLGGAGIWGVEFFLTEQEVIFSELSPRPHDTGMVTLANTLNFNEFELHARAVLGLPIPEIILHQAAASAVILANNNASSYPVYSGLEQAAAVSKTDFRIFSKPTSRPFRRMGVALAYDTIDSDIITLRNKAKQVASLIRIVE